ncbi:MAG: DUF374 domain-containing protein, partial [Woeseia sp.]|nr:DUF374 domain-containing protein [Woeseia sp.]
MSPSSPDSTTDDIERRRSGASKRRMTLGRRVYYWLGLPVLKGLSRLLWWTYRKDYAIGSETADRIISDGAVYAPVYWHQHTFCCLNIMRDWLSRGFKAGFIISASVDGDVPARIARSWGATVVRGSAKHTNALAMRDIQQAMKSGISIVSAADGPLGPCYSFKAGVVLMARIGNAPLVPISCAADRAWYLPRWDNFLLPKPFARVVIAIGEPLAVPRSTPVAELEAVRARIEQATNELMVKAQA